MFQTSLVTKRSSTRSVNRWSTLGKWGLLLMVTVAGFTLVYSPHFNNAQPWQLTEHYRLPIHFDEWFHLQAGYNFNRTSTEHLSSGFHWLLQQLNQIVNLIDIYHLLPAIWATIAGLILFIIVYHASSGRFWLALLSMVFFFSIKSNSNLLGLWFFTPLTFAVPFIFLYLYFFTEGLRRDKPGWTMISLIIMAGLLPIHAISVTFSIPLLLASCLWYNSQSRKQLKLLISGLVILTVIGGSYFMQIQGLNWYQLTAELNQIFIFPYGWGINEIRNSPLEVYNLLGYILALIGWLAIITHSHFRERYFGLWFWPIVTLLPIIVYRVIDHIPGIEPASLFAPYQRYIYYFVLSLPILSALGIVTLIKYLTRKITDPVWKVITVCGLTFTSLALIFMNYYQQPTSDRLDSRNYRLISSEELKALNWLAQHDPDMEGYIAAPLHILWAWHPQIGDNFIHVSPYTKPSVLDQVTSFPALNCSEQIELIDKHSLSYLITAQPASHPGCDWQLLYQNSLYIYSLSE